MTCKTCTVYTIQYRTRTYYVSGYWIHEQVIWTHDDVEVLLHMEQDDVTV